MIMPQFLSTGKSTVTVVRKTAGVYDDNGRYTEGTPTTITITANIQPGLKMNDTQFLPEGERGRLAIRIYTSSELRCRKEGTSGYDADEVIYMERTYVVRWCHSYHMGILNHYRVIAVAKEVT